MPGWDDWCENAMRSSNKCGIFDLQGNVWGAKPENFKANLPQPFVSGVNKLLKEGMSCGIGKLEIGGVKFMILRSEDDVVVGKQGGDKGITIAKSDKTIVVGIFDGSNKCMNSGNNRTDVQKLRDDLKQTGY